MLNYTKILFAALLVVIVSIILIYFLTEDVKPERYKVHIIAWDRYVENGALSKDVKAILEPVEKEIFVFFPEFEINTKSTRPYLSHTKHMKFPKSLRMFKTKTISKFNQYLSDVKYQNSGKAQWTSSNYYFYVNFILDRNYSNGKYNIVAISDEDISYSRINSKKHIIAYKDLQRFLEDRNLVYCNPDKPLIILLYPPGHEDSKATKVIKLPPNSRPIHDLNHSQVSGRQSPISVSTDNPVIDAKEIKEPPKIGFDDKNWRFTWDNTRAKEYHISLLRKEKDSDLRKVKDTVLVKHIRFKGTEYISHNAIDERIIHDEQDHELEVIAIFSDNTRMKGKILFYRKNKEICIKKVTTEVL